MEHDRTPTCQAVLHSSSLLQRARLRARLRGRFSRCDLALRSFANHMKSGPRSEFKTIFQLTLSPSMSKGGQEKPLKYIWRKLIAPKSCPTRPRDRMVATVMPGSFGKSVRPNLTTLAAFGSSLCSPGLSLSNSCSTGRPPLATLC